VSGEQSDEQVILLRIRPVSPKTSPSSSTLEALLKKEEWETDVEEEGGGGG